MAFAASLTELQEEASCPLCLDYLRDPVTLDCGHNFCYSCIYHQWEDLDDIFPCPVCLHHCPDKIFFRRNNQLCNLIDIVKQIPIRRTKWKLQEAEFLCETHNEVADLFCEEDLELLCPKCRVSSDHQDHLLIPTEEALLSQRKKLKRCLRVLKKRITDAEATQLTQLSKVFEVQEKMENWKMELEPEFEGITYFLKKEQVSINTTLLLEEKDVEKKLKKHKLQIANYISTLKNLLSEITKTFLQKDMDLLRSVGNLHDQYEKLSAPGVCSHEFRKESCTLPPHYFGLQNMISKFQVDLTLDPKTAHPSLTVSEDRRSVIQGTRLPSILDNPGRYIAYPAVLSCKSFDSGRHFWQVEIRGPGEWAIGVCTESVFKDHLILPNPQTSFWSFQYSGAISSIRERQIVSLGMFLDYELGEYSVYDLSDRACIYKYTSVFTEKLTPFFAIRHSSKRLSISLPTEE
ncbi:tripartite motif-containing protein 60-like [Sorex araneus]|uniref:tripartite motif-containing protein 60-like n=1 Tax=Sorex araneus TaxID=42254 RepID=UPI002433AEA4|nr:tripartite motif-containing protein 60-like [Sorex araneus]